MSLQEIEDRMADLASRLADPDLAERAYAGLWLDRLWRLRDAIRSDPHRSCT